MFWATSFMFDGKMSEEYNLFASSSNNGGDFESNASGNIKLITDVLTRRSVPYLLGISQNEVLSFEVEFTSPDEISAVDAELISQWLFGRQNYCELLVFQDDLQDVVYNCFLIDQKTIREGNIIYGFRATCVCDAPWGWGQTKTSIYDFSSDPVAYTIDFNNRSNNSDYLYPQLDFTMSGTSNGTLTIDNITDGARQFAFSAGLLTGERVTIDNDLCIIGSSSGLRRLPLFNKNWLRFLPGINHLTVTGSITSLNFSYKFAKKIGA